MIAPKTSRRQLAWELTLCCLTRSKRPHQESKADSTSLSRVMAAIANQVHSTAQQIGARIGWNPTDATQPPTGTRDVVAASLHRLLAGKDRRADTAPLYSTEPSTPKDDFSCKPARFIGCEESSDQTDVLGHAGPAERRDGLDCGGNLLVRFHRSCALGIDDPWIDRVHADISRSKLFGQDAGNTIHRTLGCRVNGRSWRSQRTRYRADIDDAAALFAKFLCSTFGGEEEP